MAHRSIGLQEAAQGAAAVMGLGRRSSEDDHPAAAMALTADGEAAELVGSSSLQLTARQQKLIRLLHGSDAARVVVRRLQGSRSSVALQLVAFDAGGRPEQQAVVLLDEAEALEAEATALDAAGPQLGHWAARVCHRPLYLWSADSPPSTGPASSLGADSEGALLLELPGACWALPEFSGAQATHPPVLASLKARLLDILAAGMRSALKTALYIPPKDSGPIRLPGPSEGLGFA